MPIVNLTTIKEWFKKFDKPTEQQFSDTWDSLWHKNDKIPEASIENLTTNLAIKQDKPAILHYADPVNTLDDLAIFSQPTLTQGQRRYVRSERADYFYDGNATDGDIAPANQLNQTGFWIKGATPEYFKLQSGTHAELSALRDAGKLITGQKYLLTDYKHTYLIEGSDTSRAVVAEDLVDRTDYDYYHHFESGISLSKNDIVTIVSLPEGYTGPAQIGDQGTVFQPYAAGNHYITGIPAVVGMGVSYEFDYYWNPYISEKTIKERFKSDLTGIINSSSDTDIITGVGTLFTSELQVGDTIRYWVDAGYKYERVVTEIVSDTELVINEIVLIGDIATDVVFEKITFGRDIMRLGGILNTEVHDGQAYSGMTAEENPAVQTEELILTAINQNSFSTKAESATYIGDIVEYIIDDTSIFSRNATLLGTRNGLVVHRENEEYNISINQDWRAQRYRRFALTEPQMERLKNLSDVYKLDSGSEVYYVGGINSLSSGKENNRYLIRDVQDGFVFTDFTLDGTVDNVFQNGHKIFQSHGTGDWEGTIYSGNYSAVNISGPGTNFDFKMEVEWYDMEIKDFPIVPLINDVPSKYVQKIKVQDLQNTFFLDKDKGMGVSAYINIEATNLLDCSFMTGGSIYSIGNIEKLISIENFEILNSGHIGYVINFAELYLKNDGMVRYSQFGGSYTYPINFIGYAAYSISSDSVMTSTIFGIGNSGWQATNHFTGTICKDVLIKYFAFASNKISITGGFLCLANHEDANYSGNVWFQRAASTANTFIIDVGFEKQTGDLFWFGGPVKGKTIITDKKTMTLYSQEITDGQISLTEISKSTKSINLVVSLFVDEETPIVGDNVVFEITASNNLGNIATNVIVNSLIPVGYTYISDDSAGEYDSVSGVWTVGNLAISESKIINITATVEETGPYLIDATVSSDDVETNPEDNTANTTTTPIAAVNDLATTITVDNASPVIGTNVIFTINGINNGNKAATNVEATSLLPDGFTYVSDDSVGGYDPVTGIWTIGDLAATIGDVLNVTATVEAAGPYQVDVAISGTEIEDLPGDNTNTITLTPTA